MTTMETRAPRRLAIRGAALIGALALAGCSSGHIGESWQCPLAKGGACDSVAAADPAVPETVGRTVLKEPLWRVRGESVRDALPSAEETCDAACGSGFDPFGWLMRLFAGGGGDDRTAGDTAQEDTPAAAASLAPAKTKSLPAQLEAVPLPDAPETVAIREATDSAGEEAHAGGLRTDEIVARIWIAPFVDAGGVYREASHVRVVLEPAGWRLK